MRIPIVVLFTQILNYCIMTLLKQINETEANDVVKQVYQGFTQNIGRVPNVVKFHSVSPTIFPYLMGMVNEFSNHPTIDPILVSYLRMLVSHKYAGEYCVKFQSFLIKNRGESHQNITQAIKNPQSIKMDEKRKELLLFALDVVCGHPDNIEDRIQHVKSLGWTDSDIYELCFLGGLQKGMVPLIKGFKVEHDY